MSVLLAPRVGFDVFLLEPWSSSSVPVWAGCVALKTHSTPLFLFLPPSSFFSPFFSLSSSSLLFAFLFFSFSSRRAGCGALNTHLDPFVFFSLLLLLSHLDPFLPFSLFLALSFSLSFLLFLLPLFQLLPVVPLRPFRMACSSCRSSTSGCFGVFALGGDPKLGFHCFSCFLVGVLPAETQRGALLFLLFSCSEKETFAPLGGACVCAEWQNTL